MNLFFAGAKIALGFIFLVCISLLISEPFGNLILKLGKSVQDIKPVLYFLMLLTTIMFLGFTFAPR